MGKKTAHPYKMGNKYYMFEVHKEEEDY